MGTFGYLIKSENTSIPEEKRKEFEERAEKLFQAGGMMDMEYLSILGKKLNTIRIATMDNGIMDFYYNYFEDDVWENAGYRRKERSVWSNKIGWKHFYLTVIAAYVLEALYTNGPAHPMAGGEFIADSDYVSWINYLFGTSYARLNKSPWPIYVEIKKERRDGPLGYDYRFDRIMYASDESMKGYLDILAVENGTEFLIGKYAGEEPEKKGKPVNTGEFYRRVKPCLIKIREESNLPVEELAAKILGAYKNFGRYEEMEDERISALAFWTIAVGSPVFLCKAMEEVYGLDFWEIWEQIRPFEEEWHKNWYRERDGGGKDDMRPMPPLSTQQFFQVADDDMIPYWTPGGDIHFSDSLKSWFAELKDRYETLCLEKTEAVEKPLHWITGLMELAMNEFYRVYTFTDFWEETLANLTDTRYMKLWGLYEEMIRDSLRRLEEAERDMSEGKYRRTQRWHMHPSEKLENPERQMLRRYMALVGNKELRKEVFGF